MSKSKTARDEQNIQRLANNVFIEFPPLSLTALEQQNQLIGA